MQTAWGWEGSQKSRGKKDRLPGLVSMASDCNFFVVRRKNKSRI